ncbi:uncharacterized protein PgNI_08716 [Pyricularia grisea]|uniref:Uncharacterized protein n=1 Tax=Pyricularia grisea TaxID=148305 RepID=A0A6P8AWR3_PYRGI|nr:uncharacterized protein PgNI_08716 [Pyricularia grisea]TLD06663.1 hypothetical protein PgNI_08716 [Pyricularia grisea]
MSSTPPKRQWPPSTPPSRPPTKQQVQPTPSPHWFGASSNIDFSFNFQSPITPDPSPGNPSCTKSGSFPDHPVIQGAAGTASPPGLLANDLSQLSLGSQSPDPFSPERHKATGTLARAPPAPYRVETEEGPAHEFFTSSFQDNLSEAINVAQEAVLLIEKLRAAGVSDEILMRLLEDARRLGSYTGSETRTIAVLGDSGQGKSSLINSLLHYPEISKTGDIGSACTSVVTEYREKKPAPHGAGASDQAPITLEVEYLSGIEIKEMVTELLWSYRQLFLPAVESDTTSDADYARYMRESEQAWSALEAAFGHRREFKRAMLQDMAEGSLERITEMLVGWTEDIEWPSGDETAGYNGDDEVTGNEPSHLVWRSTAATAEECCEKTSLFMQDRYWPFTKIIRVYLDSDVLKNGLVLADLPGLQDTNLARVRATQDYLMRCENVFVVANIARAITDQSLKSSLYNVLAKNVPLTWEEADSKGRGLINIAVVCTKSEDINLRAARVEFCGRGKPIDPDVLADLDRDIEAADRCGERRRYKDLKNRRKLLMMRARSEHVKAGLRQAYASRVPGEALRVFCVSNSIYEKYAIDFGDGRSNNSELVAASEIPDVRRFCRSITAEARHREARHFVCSSVAGLLGSLRLWVGSAQDTRVVENDNWIKTKREELSGSVQDARTEIMEAAAAVADNFKNCFKDQILSFLDGRNAYWERAAKHEGEQWQSWHWTQYSAFCLNNGHHETPKRPRQDWNAKILWKMRSELAYQWELVEEEAGNVFDVFLDLAKDQLEEIRDQVEEASVTLPSCASLAEALLCHIKDLEYRTALRKAEFVCSVRTIRRYASESNHMSYVLSGMLPTYRQASSQSGTGKAARQKSIVQGRITDGTLFPGISMAISTAVEAAVQKSQVGLSDDVAAVLDRVNADVKLELRRWCHRNEAAEMTTVAATGRNTNVNVPGSSAVATESTAALLVALGGEVEELWQRHAGLVRSVSTASDREME